MVFNFSTNYVRCLSLGFIVAIGLFSWWLSPFFPLLGSVTIAILLGIIVGNIVPNSDNLQREAVFTEKQMLPMAIALLGVELHFATLFELGTLAILIIFGTIIGAIITSLSFGRLLGFSPKASLLMGAGNGICGSSAIAATAIVVEPEESDVGISIGVVNLLGTVGIFLMPVLIGSLQFSESQGGLLIGGTLQSVGQVVASGYAINEVTGSIALVAKMGRVLMLVPIILGIGLFMASMSSSSDHVGTKKSINVPWFIVVFFVLSIFANLNVFSESLVEGIQFVSKFLLIVAMAGIGIRIQLRTIFQSGPKALFLGICIWICQLVIVIAIIGLGS